MGFLDRLLGRPTTDQGAAQPQPVPQASPQPRGEARTDDEIAVERYRYLLRTAPPETLEAVHEEAFAKLSPEQRRLVFEQLSQHAPEGEKPRGEDAASLARSATRTEMRQPGFMERSFGGQGGARGGMGFGSMLGASMLGTIGGLVVGSALVSAFTPDMAAADVAGGDPGADAGADADAGGDYGGGDYAGGGDVGGDFSGGGDFGGGFDGGFGDF